MGVKDGAVHCRRLGPRSAIAPRPGRRAAPTSPAIRSRDGSRRHAPGAALRVPSPTKG